MKIILILLYAKQIKMGVVQKNNKTLKTTASRQQVFHSSRGMMLSFRVALSSLIVITLSSAAPPRPLFSWASVPLFQHLASVNGTHGSEFPAERLSWLASRFPVVILEHAQSMGAWAYNGPSGPGSTWGPAPFSPPGGYIEDHFASAAAAIKALNNSVTVLYYQQITGALPYFRASGAVNQNKDWALDSGTCAPALAVAGQAAPTPLGDILPNYVTYAFDHTKDGVTDNFVANFVNMTSSTVLDGTFIDTAYCYSAAGQGDASDATVRAMQAAVPNKIVGYHTENAPFAGASAAMSYTFAVPGKKKHPTSLQVGKPGKDTSGLAAVAWLDANAAAGTISFAHIGDVAGGSDQVYSLAVFLAGAYNQSYFAFSSAEKTAPAWQQCDPAAATWPVFPTWCTGQGYSPDYDRPLGEPLGPRVVTGGKLDEVTRSFRSGTKVTVELSGSACSIAWADGATTSCA